MTEAPGVKLRVWEYPVGTYQYHVFTCPGCETEHAVRLERSPQGPAVHTFNGSVTAPTLGSSVLVHWVKQLTEEQYAAVLRGEKFEPVKMVCHSYVEAGMIRFLGDCTHKLAGQTVALPDVKPSRQ